MEALITLVQGHALSLAFSLSYIFLFIVLTLYKYEVIFRTGVLLVALTGPFFPLLYGLPYIFVMWRFFVGLNVATDQKLYIGRLKGNSDNKSIEQNDMDKADFSGSTTLNHWVVVIQKGNEYIYTHAVGEVVSGEGIKIPFKDIKEDKLFKKYCLNPVGFVTKRRREEKLEEIVENEPMVSGNSCQEYAVDLAFQLSSSRTYTFVRIMTLSRFRNFLYYSAMGLSEVLIYFEYPYAILLNPLVLTNLFVAWELSRIGFHNSAQGSYLPVIRAYLHYPTRGNFLTLAFVTVALVYLYYQLSVQQCVVVGGLVMVVILAVMK